jgi:hypothetical protein
MITKKASLSGWIAAALSALALLAPAAATADEFDPPSRVARLAFTVGSVSLQPGGTDDWVAAPVNRPLTTGDKLWSDRDSRAELQLDGSLLRLSNDTAISVLNLGDNVTQIQLSAGTLLVRVRRLDDDETFEIDTPNLAFSILRPGLYRLAVDESGNTTSVGVRRGQGEATGGGSAYAVRANEYDTFSGTDLLEEAVQPYGPAEDPFDAWSSGRDSRWEHSASARYVSPDIVGYEDLDEQGSWRATPDYGYAWFPGRVPAGWAPYHTGHWAYIAPWGYTWVDDQPWGFAPFHYGRWISADGVWAWIPSPPRVEGVAYVRPVYAPALVAWVGVGAGIAWFALGPREVFVPSYPVSQRYVNNINISNTSVSTTVVNNIYNTTIVNKTVNVTNVTYVNRTVAGAVAATTAQAFTTAQPVSKNPATVDQRTFADARVQVFAPAAVPTKQAVLGSGRATTTMPPARIQTRAVVARIAPPPPPPTFEKRQEAIRSNSGKPLSVSEVRQIQAQETTRSAPVKIAPPATPVAMRSAEPANLAKVPAKADLPPARPMIANPEAGRPPPVATHPKELAQPSAPPSPRVADSALERQHLQEQQQLRAQQDAERQRVQQQQELEHQRLAKEKADEAAKQQLEQQHQQQTQQLQQKHAQEQLQLREKQSEQRRQQESQTRIAKPKEDRPPNARP